MSCSTTKTETGLVDDEPIKPFFSVETGLIARSLTEFDSVAVSRLKHKDLNAAFARRVGDINVLDGDHAGFASRQLQYQALGVVEHAAFELDADGKSQFISTLFGIGADCKADAMRARSYKQQSGKHKGKKAAAKSTRTHGGTPGNSWPAVFEHALVREAFTLCAALLSMEELQEILINSWGIYFPLTVCNYEAACAFAIWPKVSTDWVPRIFDLENIRGACPRPQFSNAAAAQYMQPVPESSITKFYLSISNSLGLDVFKHPAFVRQASVEVIKSILEAYAYDLMPLEREVLIRARGGLNVLSEEIGNEPCAWVFLRTFKLLYEPTSTALSNEYQALRSPSGSDQVDSLPTNNPGSNEKSVPNLKQHVPLPILLPAPDLSDPDAQLNYLVDTELLISHIAQNGAIAGKVVPLTIACLQHWVLCEFVILVIVVTLCSPSLPARERDIFELLLVAVLKKLSKLIRCIRKTKDIYRRLPPEGFVPLSSKIRIALFNYLKMSCRYAPDEKMVAALRSFAERDPKCADQRRALLARYAQSANGSIRDSIVDSFDAWICFFANSKIANCRPTMLFLIFMLFDDFFDTVQNYGGEEPFTREQDGYYAAIILAHSYQKILTPMQNFWVEDFSTMATMKSGAIAIETQGYPIKLLHQMSLALNLLNFVDLVNQVAEWPGSLSKLDRSIIVGQFAEIGAVALGAQNGLNESIINVNALAIAMELLRDNCNITILPPILSEAQVKSLTRLSQERLDKLIKPSNYYYYFRSFKAFNMTDFLIEYDGPVDALHTVPESKLVDWCRRRHGIFNYPERLIGMCNRKMYCSKDFTDFFWENPAGKVLLLLDPVFSQDLNLLYLLTIAPLEYSLAHEMSDLRSVTNFLWKIIRYLVMQDYGYRLFDALINVQDVFAADVEQIQLAYMRCFILEVRTRQVVSCALGAIDITGIINNDFKESRVAHDFKTMLTDENWKLFISLERLKYLRKNLGAMNQLGADTEHSDLVKVWLASDETVHRERYKLLLKLIDEYAPCKQVAHVWACRLRACWMFDSIAELITAETNILTLDRIPNWLAEAETNGTLPIYDIVIGLKATASDCFKKDILTAIVNARRQQANK